MDNIKEIGKLIQTQNNRITDQPMFVVQRKRRSYGFDSEYADSYVWLCDDSCEEVDDETAEKIEEKCDSYSDTYECKNEDDESEKYRKCHYKDYWDFVTACFTEKGCEDYLARDGHNLGETRIYAYGSYRNVEWQTVRNMLIEEADKPPEIRDLLKKHGMPVTRTGDGDMEDRLDAYITT